MGARLLVSFQGAEFAFDLRGDAVRVGSAPTCGLVLKDPGVSKEHAEVRRAGNAWRLVDLESASGTRVNGLYVNKQDLKNGDVIALGGARLTFQSDEAAAPAPIPGMAAASAAPAPIPAARAAQAPLYAAPPVYAVPQAYSPPPAAAPLPRAPAPPPPSRGRREREREEDSRGRRRAGRGGGGGGAGAAKAIMIVGGLLVVIIAVAVASKMTRGGGLKADPNEALLAQMEQYRKQGNWEAIIALEGQGDRGNPFSIRDVNIAIADAKRALAAKQVETGKQEAEQVYQGQILPFRDLHGGDDRALIARCDDFIRRWPTHERAESVAMIRLQVSGEPSPVWQELHGGGGVGSGAFVSMGDLMAAADREATRCVSDGDYAAAFRAYDKFLASGRRNVVAEFQEQFKADIAKKKRLLEKDAHDAFERIEDRAMALEDQRRWDECEKLYTESKAKFGLADIIERCDAEIARLRTKH